MKKVAFYTLGCKVNQYETNAMEQQFIEKGYEVVSFSDIADIYIVNTCTVTNMSDKKSRQMIRRAKQLNSKSIVVAVGCYVQVAKECANGFDIFIKEKAVLDNLVEKVYDFSEVTNASNAERKNVAKRVMCGYYYDIRAFGAVIATSGKQDQVRGPIQMTFARSIDPIATAEHSITRMAVTKEADLEKERSYGNVECEVQTNEIL